MNEATETLEYPATLATGLFGPHDVPLEPMPENDSVEHCSPEICESEGGTHD